MKRFAIDTWIFALALSAGCSSTPASSGLESSGLASPSGAALLGDGVARAMVDGHPPSDVLVYAKGKADLGSEALPTSRAERTTEVHRRLVAHAVNAQQSLRTWLTEQGAATTSFHIVNAVLVKGAAPHLLRQLAARADVAKIALDARVASDAAVETMAVSPSARGIAWGIERTGAPRAWESGFTGAGVVVGLIGSGVRGTHEALRGNFRGLENHGWYDAVDGLLTPYDPVGTGTHIAGIAVGANGIGMAPDARWMACAACRSEGCADSALLKCGEFMLCPRGDACEAAPHVVVAGFGGGRGHTFYNEIIDAWRAAGIIPVFAVGNHGPSCATAHSPGDQPNIISVGATTPNGEVSPFSSRGPSVDGRIAPTLVAPGSHVLSAGLTRDTSYETKSGTAFAAAHVAGGVALLLSVSPNMTFEQVTNAIASSADATAPAGQSCGGIADDVFPNNLAGFGTLNIQKALASVLETGE
ncbi:S8 family serine peptidase [Pendulispora albinea]|uniref:S8 family serine peptidase n=1 Tax=Pendulispora albinea TaxID=2741071 RepID=A0ABZ2M7L8_9BACT